MYKSLILTITFTIFSSVAYGKKCSNEQLTTCAKFCESMSMYSELACTGTTANLRCYGYLKETKRPADCIPEVLKACSVQISQINASCICKTGGGVKCGV